MGDSEFGARLKKAREDVGLKQSEVCEALGIPKVQTLSAYERGVNFPPIETLKKLAKSYNVSSDWLLFGTENAVKVKKTPLEYLRQIVDGVDALKLYFGNTECLNSAIGSDLCIVLLSDKYQSINDFAYEWRDLRKLRDNGTIAEDDYDTLIKKRLSRLSDLNDEQDTFSLLDNDDAQLPF